MNSRATPPAHFCDAKGLACPLPVLRARRMLATLPAKARLEIHATDPMTAIDLPHFCQQSGHRLIAQETKNDLLIFVIEVKAV